MFEREQALLNCPGLKLFIGCQHGVQNLQHGFLAVVPGFLHHDE
jgi:hypothetical protein